MFIREPKGARIKQQFCDEVVHFRVGRGEVWGKRGLRWKLISR